MHSKITAPLLATLCAAPGLAAAFDNDTLAIEEIVVTAQRRDQRLQDVPIAVTAADAHMLEMRGIDSTTDLAVLDPAVTFSTGLGGASISIRGVGGTGSGGDESANAVYIDGVYIPSPGALLFQFNNIERIEVLKGPQGTLFGRNASGGAIQVITKAPSFTPTGSVEVGYGNYDTKRANAYFSTGITDNIAFSIAATAERQSDGWGHNVASKGEAYTGHYTGVRGKLLWNIDERTSAIASYLFSDSQDPSVQGSQILPGERLVSGGGTLGFFDQNESSPNNVEARERNYSLTIKHRADFATLTSITSRDDTEFRLVTDADLSPIPLVTVDINGPNKSWTQELQVASPDSSKITWIGGLFYYHNDLLTSPFRTIGVAFAPLAYRQVDAKAVTDSYAGYGQATFPLAPHTNVTTGLRYTVDKRDFDIATSTSNLSVPPVASPQLNVTDKKLTWRLALDQRLTEQVLAYASFSRGFKSGLFNSTNAGTPPVGPQTIDAYEAGLKSDLFERRVRANLSVFHYKLDDLQLRGIPTGAATPIYYNAASGKVNGAEAALEFAATRQLSVQANVSYLNGHYGDDFNNALLFRVNSAPAFGLTQLPPGSASGNRMVYTPEWVTSLGAQYRIPLSFGTIDLAGSWTYNGGYFFDPQNRVKSNPYHLLNASVNLEMARGFSARLYGNNLSQARYYTAVQPSNFGDYYFPAAPRTYGIWVGYKF
jgi:iron complex outermembrane recepter protein